MERKLNKLTSRSFTGFTLIEVMVVLILLTLSFMVFLQALNTGKTVRSNSELRTVQALILNSLQQEIRARKYDHNDSKPWSGVLGPESGESAISSFNDIDDFHQYAIASVDGNDAYSCFVEVSYVQAADGFQTEQSNPTDFKSVLVRVSHKTLPPLTDIMIISSGF